MKRSELHAALGSRVRISAGIQSAEGTLSDFEQSTMDIGLWGGSTTHPGNEWYVTLDRTVHEFPLGAKIEVLD